jgi:hypothetical protein
MQNLCKSMCFFATSDLEVKLREDSYKPTIDTTDKFLHKPVDHIMYRMHIQLTVLTSAVSLLIYLLDIS